MIGRRLSDRYEILSRIGDGGMAIVYKARDLILDRFVAVKILRSEFSRDEEFIKRFHREAESVASLSHPNIVSIYDIGEEEDCYYIVMEYVEGATLKTLIKHYAPLPYDETIYIMKQILSGIEHAHSYGIVHRDLKPHNILIDDDDHVKVTDFGIAVAMTSATLTFTNSIMGSAHYLSPEQARGGKATFKSDIYSLGIVLFEMLTGEVPFAGDSPVSVALKHLNESMPRPKMINPDIPQSLENIAMKALAKDPDDRYNTITEMSDDLTTALDPERLEEPPFIIPESDDDDEKTKIISPIVQNEQNRDTKNKIETEPVDKKNEPKKKRRVPRWVWMTLILFFILAGGTVAAFTVIPQLLQVKNVTVPNVVGKPYDSAVAAISNANLKVAHKTVSNPGFASGIVVKTDPTAHTVVKANSVVTLYVSDGPPKKTRHNGTNNDNSAVNSGGPARVTVPNVTNETKSDAQSTIEAEGLNVDFQQEYSDTVAKGSVTREQPAENTQVDQGSWITVWISNGPEKVTVPNVTNELQTDAQSTLKAEGLKVDFQQEYSNTVAKGSVTREQPAGNTQVDPGSTITVWISKGPEKVTVPNVTNEMQTDAQSTLEAQGFKVNFKQEYSDTVAKGSVTRQDPAGNTQAAPGSTIAVWISKGPEKKPVQDNIQINVALDPNQNQPSDVKIVYSDANHDNATFIEESISKSKTYVLPVTINPGGEASYKVIIDGEVKFQDTIKYSDVQQ